MNANERRQAERLGDCLPGAMHAGRLRTSASLTPSWPHMQLLATSVPVAAAAAAAAWQVGAKRTQVRARRRVSISVTSPLSAWTDRDLA